MHQAIPLLPGLQVVLLATPVIITTVQLVQRWERVITLPQIKLPGISVTPGAMAIQQLIPLQLVMELAELATIARLDRLAPPRILALLVIIVLLAWELL